jgi:hypothetical protein
MTRTKKIARNNNRVIGVIKKIGITHKSLIKNEKRFLHLLAKAKKIEKISWDEAVILMTKEDEVYQSSMMKNKFNKILRYKNESSQT